MEPLQILTVGVATVEGSAKPTKNVSKASTAWPSARPLKHDVAPNAITFRQIQRTVVNAITPAKVVSLAKKELVKLSAAGPKRRYVQVHASTPKQTKATAELAELPVKMESLAKKVHARRAPLVEPTKRIVAGLAST